MSRTDVHRPAWVQERDPELRHLFVEYHDHRAGRCDLDVYLSTPGWVRTTCSVRYVGGRNIYCGCHLCTGQPGRRLAHRQERTRWRADRQRLLAARAEDRDGLDVAPFPAW
jgi:hypothetical protein